MFRANDVDAVELVSMLARGESKLAVAEHVMSLSSSWSGDKVSWLVIVGGDELGRIEMFSLKDESVLPFRNQVIFITTFDSV